MTFAKMSKHIPFLTCNAFISSIFEAFGVIHVVRKNGGSDDGKLYAMKAVNITHAIEYVGSTTIIDSLNSEREVSISMI